ncbi:MAG: ATP-dependent DNA helicase, partial [Lachnospiraceae bacterium]|nr:ATP-dependent DNA helicase [Lachnospiraceae bacterium]
MFELKDGKIKISVRNLVEFILREGDLKSGQVGSGEEKAMEAGRRIHKKIQKSMPLSYRSEVSLKQEFIRDHYTIVLEGRADGIDERPDEVVIDEIKGMYRDVNTLKEPIQVHRAQAMCYGYLYLMEHSIDRIFVQMTYCKEQWERSVLEEWFYHLIDDFGLFCELLYQFREERVSSIPSLPFPFFYRKGQKEMVNAVYYAIREKKKMF